MRTRLGLLLALIVILCSTVPAGAYTVSTTGNWIDVTSYCGSGVCVPITANHKADASVSYYYIHSHQKVTYYQTHGGLLYPNSSICGRHDWVKGGSSYSTATGSVSIGGWYSTGALCSPSAVCKHFVSQASYSVTGNPVRGYFSSFTNFTTRCIPVSVSHTISVAF